MRTSSRHSLTSLLYANSVWYLSKPSVLSKDHQTLKLNLNPLADLDNVIFSTFIENSVV